MSASSLMDRARVLLQRHGATAALVIVPLATAVPGRADSVSFENAVNTSVTTVISGGGTFVFGNANGSGAGSNVSLSGNTIMPDTGQYLTAQRAQLNAGALELYWNGTFNAPGGLDTISIPSFSLTIGSTYQSADTIGWFFTVNLLDASGTILAQNDISGGAFGTVNFTNDPTLLNFVTASDPVTWEAVLDVTWNYPKENSVDGMVPSGTGTADHLTLTTAIDLGVSGLPNGFGIPPGNPVPLPATVWSGGTLLLAMGLYGGLRRLRRVQPATAFTNPH